MRYLNGIRNRMWTLARVALWWCTKRRHLRRAPVATPNPRPSVRISVLPVRTPRYHAERRTPSRRGRRPARTSPSSWRTPPPPHRHRRRTGLRDRCSWSAPPPRAARTAGRFCGPRPPDDRRRWVSVTGIGPLFLRASAGPGASLLRALSIPAPALRPADLGLDHAVIVTADGHRLLLRADDDVLRHTQDKKNSAPSAHG